MRNQYNPYFYCSTPISVCHYSILGILPFIFVYSAVSLRILLGLVRENRATPAFPCFPWFVSTSTPKPRAEGSSPSAPAKKVRYPLLRHLTFSLVCGMSWQRGTAAPRAVRVVGACSPVGCVQARPRRQPRQVLLLLPKKPAETLRFCRFFCTCCMGMRFALVQTSGFLT